MTLSVITAFTISEPAVKTPCPLPYVDVDGKYCFYITLTEQNFTSSNAVCQETNGFLAQINTEEKNASFVKYVEGRFNFCLSHLIYSGPCDKRPPLPQSLGGLS